MFTNTDVNGDGNFTEAELQAGYLEMMGEQAR
jgi:hypothetical protein